MSSTTLKVLLQRLMEQNGDYLTVSTTTHITTDKKVISTTLNQYDGGVDGTFDNWWVYIDGTTNAGVLRRLGSTTYDTATGTLYVYGANLVAETAARSIYVMQYNRDTYKNALNDTLREIYDNLYKYLDVQTLITGNILPNSHFEDQATSGTPDKYAFTNASGTATTTAGEIRGGAKAIKVTASANNGYMTLKSNTYPRLLDLMGQTINFKCWALPQVDDDATIVIFTIGSIKEGEYTADAGTDATKIVDSELDSSVDDYYNGDYVWNATRSLGAVVTDYDGATKTLTVAIASQTNGDIYHIRTTQTLTSTTACPAGKYTLLELEDQVLNDDLVEIEFRFKIATNAKYVIFDNARVTGRNLYEYMMPTDFQNGDLYQVFVQTSGYSDDPCDDLHPKDWEEVFGSELVHDGTNEYLRLPFLYGSARKIRLVGTAPLSIPTTDEGTIEVGGEQVNLIIAYAKYKLAQMLQLPISSEDIRRYGSAEGKAYAEYMRLTPKLKMPRLAYFLKLPVY